MAIVVRRTFFEVDDGFCVLQRSRSYTDTLVEYEGFATHEVVCKADRDGEASDASTIFDGSSRSDSDDAEDQADACHQQPPAKVLDLQILVPGFERVDVAAEPWPQADKVHAWPKHLPASPTISQSASRTTLMLRNVPNVFARAQLLQLLNDEGFFARYDFVYLPVDFASGAGLGYAFVNMISNEHAELLKDRLHGYSAWASGSRKVLEVCWSDPHQGLDTLVERYRNSRIMHAAVPEENKPALFVDGARAAFPGPTKRIRAPFSGNRAAHKFGGGNVVR